jgi:hypothetical protein
MSYAWFLIMYVLIGVLFMWFGSAMVRHPERMTNYLIKTAQSGQHPRLLIKWLKYFSMVILLSFVVSFFPFYWPGLVFSFAGVVMIFIFGRMLTRWDQIKIILTEKRDGLMRLTRMSGIFLLTYAALCLLMWYLHLSW